MKVLFKSFYLFLLGLKADLYKKSFDRAMDRALAHGGDISSKKLTKMSDKSYRLYMKFKDIEKNIRHEMEIYAVR